MQNPGGVNIPKTPELLRDFEQFKRELKQRTGLDLEQYKFDQTYRRIWTMAERAGFSRFTDYLRYLSQDESRMRAFIDRLAINVSEMFRNPEQFEILHKEVLPHLLQRRHSLKVWSAGCSYGAEAYSIAILLHELAPNRGHQILGTDIDTDVLERAQRGVFAPSDVRNVPPLYLQRYFRVFEENGRTLYEADPILKRYLRFQKHNLLSDPYPQGFDLIACRNVIIYFSEEAKERIFREFYRALTPGGYLFLGNTERIFHYQQIGYENPFAFYYRKPEQEVQRWRNAS
ncbi:MAG: protein-glutamate O-methyltransferase CheR [Fimbriimonadales bacterium]|jgi:chemotaxis protein methyltransferase CheR|nr:protein-glutamate O-methyltransferase CheR [Armatimonadota bacterium]MCX7686686.1 protein-glutamate O-methyltransferase CheR [Fimbriimonadales bacterium]CUU10690.1 chemotaxis protein methyltransferase CheR [Armatimonadetes bacterium GBS]CUU35975.1 chemotaxis protein methyltransferase CheR [Armatimonadetes bacterium GXS]CUU38088.1 chemotaxis protein methyltransferase CheR [Armatimonadetes bacterium DC]GBC90096.1 Chemotaxis protein methyltransferase [bacterium HR14]